MSIFPQPLKRGSKVLIWAPASPGPYLYPRRFHRAIDALIQQGFEVEISDSCKSNQDFEVDFAERLVGEFHSYLKRKDIDAIWYATGGWTTIALLPLIDWDLVRLHPKHIIGYSDATSLLLACYAKTDLVTFHGPMVIPEFGEQGGPWEYTVSNLWSVINRKDDFQTCIPPDTWTEEILWWDKEDHRRRKPTQKGEWRYFQNGYAEGIIVGGNLATLSLLLGTDYFPQNKDMILFIETQDFSPDQFLAYLSQLKISGVFDRTSGLIVGRHANSNATSNGIQSFDRMLTIALTDLDIPVLIDVDLGHTEPMLTIPIGAKVVLDSQEIGFTISLKKPSK